MVLTKELDLDGLVLCDGTGNISFNSGVMYIITTSLLLTYVLIHYSQINHIQIAASLHHPNH